MTDQERAWAVITTLEVEQDLGLRDGDRADLVRRVAEEFSQVRLTERRAIATYLHARGTSPSLSVAACAALHDAADRIEKGEHGS